MQGRKHQKRTRSGSSSGGGGGGGGGSGVAPKRIKQAPPLEQRVKRLEDLLSSGKIAQMIQNTAAAAAERVSFVHVTAMRPRWEGLVHSFNDVVRTEVTNTITQQILKQLHEPANAEVIAHVRKEGQQTREEIRRCLPERAGRAAPRLPAAAGQNTDTKKALKIIDALVKEDENKLSIHLGCRLHAENAQHARGVRAGGQPLVGVRAAKVADEAD